jgi:hypothetical protein
MPLGDCQKEQILSGKKQVRLHLPMIAPKIPKLLYVFSSLDALCRTPASPALLAITKMQGSAPGHTNIRLRVICWLQPGEEDAAEAQQRVVKAPLAQRGPVLPMICRKRTAAAIRLFPLSQCLWRINPTKHLMFTSEETTTNTL